MKKQALCHPDKKHQGKGLCRTCYHKQWSEKNPDKALAIQKRRQEKDKSGLAKEKKRLRNIKLKYKLSAENYQTLLTEQNNKCRICKCSPTGSKALHVDHCHNTGKVRGLLCAQCNWYVGKIDKDNNILRELEKYDERWKKV